MVKANGMTHSPSPINGVIFDLDGTLINTLSAIGNAFNLALEEQGWDQHPLDRFATFIGSGARVAASRALPEAARADDTIDRLVARQREIHETIWKDEVTVYKGIPELLDYLAKKDNIVKFSNIKIIIYIIFNMIYFVI